MAILALRALRAAVQVLRSGYEDQSLGYQRLIDELHNRVQKVRKDTSGDYARQWLEGRGRVKGAKLAGQEFWEAMSGPVHAEVRAVLDWIAVTQPDGSAKVVIGPERRSKVANAALSYMASQGRDIASILAIETDQVLELTALDASIREALASYIRDQEEDARSDDRLGGRGRSVGTLELVAAGRGKSVSA